ncbi:branched-chain amino acid ABC transporter permease [Acrocarpospora catenulata]|uniref:branched-chain amino acid ABC transporter permease n=1 Tax=Acrocarpospora catenulata TaxID=2836182 RepID=UPI001BD9F1E5|nr:branched-chain amino acid ABC transporter permease [Acrocarpospora catenulata]
MDLLHLIQENQVLLRQMGINILLAYAMFLPLSMGQFQVAQPVFVAVAGYTGAILTLNTELALPVKFLMAVGASVAFAILLAPLMVRLSGIYLGLTSFALVGLVSVVASNLQSLGGATGLYAIPRLVDLRAVWITVAIVVALAYLLKRSRFGMAMSIVNDDPIAAAGTGLSVFRMHVYVFVLSAVIASVAGFERVHLFHQINAQDFSLHQILGILTFVIVGGLRSMWGPLVGVIVVMLIQVQIEDVGDWNLAVNGILLLAIVIFLPDGLTSLRAGMLRRIGRRRVIALDGKVNA